MKNYINQECDASTEDLACLLNMLEKDNILQR